MLEDWGQDIWWYIESSDAIYPAGIYWNVHHSVKSSVIGHVGGCCLISCFPLQSFLRSCSCTLFTASMFLLDTRALLLPCTMLEQCNSTQLPGILVAHVALPPSWGLGASPSMDQPCAQSFQTYLEYLMFPSSLELIQFERLDSSEALYCHVFSSRMLITRICSNRV